MNYPDTLLSIGGSWQSGSGSDVLPVLNPASGERIGSVAKATAADLERAVQGAVAGFTAWSAVSAVQRAAILHKAADNLRAAVADIAPLITLEQGKPLWESRNEIAFAAEVIDWFAEEGRRVYGRIIPSRDPQGTAQAVVQPLGVIAGLTPWNYPLGQAVRKVAIALAAGCSMILKVAEETPAAAAEMVKAFERAGLPAGTLSLVYGDPREISEFLISHPDVNGISFTGSTAVGRELTSLAGRHLKRSVMELGGHAPVLVFDDADVSDAVARLAADKFHNAGQACISPTRFMVQQGVFDGFLDGFAAKAKALKVGDGFAEGVHMGPLANGRRVEALSALVDDAVAQGGRVVTGGERIGNRGNFFQPTVLADVPTHARIMNEEPFGPVAIINRFTADDEAIAEANRLDYALAAYAFTRSETRIRRLTTAVRSGMIGINHNDLGVPEAPFAGMRASGFGDEGAFEAMREMTTTRYVSVRHVA